MEQDNNEPTVSPLQPSHYYNYEPNDYVKRHAKHVLSSVPLFVIRRINSSIDKEAYEARYIDQNGVLVLDIFFPEEFSFTD